MSISSQLPVVFHAQAGSLLRGMALVPGQTVEARVLHQNGNGATQVQIGKQAVTLNLPQSMAAGSILTLAVQQADGQMRLSLVSSRPPATPQAAQPATTIQISQGQGAPVPSAPPPSYGPAVMAAPASAAGLTAGTSAPLVTPPPAASASPIALAPGAGPAAVTGATPVMATATARMAASPYGAATPAPTAPGPPSAQPVLAQMVQQALPVQSSLAGVTSMLTALVAQANMPEPVLKAARQVLGNQLTLDGKIDAAALKSAIGNSGLFQEAALAGGRSPAAAGDTKSGLLALRQGLVQWLGGEAQIAQIARIPPPLRGMVPRAQLAEPPPLDPPLEGEDAGRLLLERTEGALSRLRLHQHASLPESTHRSEAQWNLDLPIAVAGYQTLLQLQIHRDGHGDTTPPEERSWQVRFALNLPEMGEVGAQVSLRGKLTAILLWGERPDVVAGLSEHVEALREELAGVGLVPGAIVVRAGPPADPAAGAASGQMLDALR